MRILLVDDDRHILKAMEVLLKNSGFETEAVTTAAEALRAAGEREFDLVLLDVVLPDMEGIEVCRTLKANRDHFLPIILVTGRDSPEQKIHGLEVGADDYMTKPFDNRELLARVKALLRIKTLHDEVRRLAQVREEIVYTIGHDFRTPLVGIRGAVQNLLNGLVGDLTPEQREYLELVDQATVRLSRLIDEMLRISRNRGDADRRSDEKVDLKTAVETAAAGFRPEMVKRGIRLEIDAAVEAPPVRGDRDRLTQVMANLIDNAVKHSPDGGTIRVEIRREVRPQGIDVHVVVSDEGPGIARSDFERIFFRFEQVGDPEVTNRSGTGLGLAICKDVVEEHGGRIWVESEPGRGARFHVKLKATRAARGAV